MKRKGNSNLLIWLPTGLCEGSNFYTMCRSISHPVFLFGVTVVDIVAMIYFNLTNIWWMWAVAPSAVCLAIVAILLRRRASGKLLISKWQAIRCNTFSYVVAWLPNRYQNLINLTTERTQDDNTVSTALFRQLGEALIILGLYDETEYKKVGMFTGNEFQLVEPIEFYTDIIETDGIGYILFEPSVEHIAKMATMDEKIISRTLREIGLVDWSVKRMTYDDDILLFILNDETISNAYDFSGE